jgi:perosamine synthetase
LNFGGGLTANIHVNWLSPVKVRRMIFGGDQRMLMYDELSSNEKIRVFESRAVSVPSELRDSAAPLHRIDYRVGDIWTPHLPPREALAVEADHLVSAIQKGVSLLADGAAGLRVVEVLEACDRSLQSAGTAAQPATRKLTRHPGFGTTRPSEVVKVHATSPPETIPLAKPVLGEPELARVRDVLLSGWVTQGPVTAAFESAVASYVGAEHAVAVSSATAALHLALCVLDVGDGDEVVVPSFTFVATANAIRYRGAKPVFVDVDPDSFNLDPRSVARVLTDRTKAILAVHQFGNPADLTDLRAIAQRHGCPLVEDAACALGSRWRGRPIGSDSALACFSFHPRKVVTTGEGGMIVTGNEEWAKRLRRLRHHGMDGTDWQRHQQLLPHRESYVEVGFNYRMSDLAAAVGLAQMERLDDLIEERIRLCENYDRGLSGHPSLEIRPLRPGTRSNGQTYAVCVRDDGPLNRDGLMRFLRRRGIAAKPGPACIHLEPCYRPLHPSLSLPHSEALDRRMLLLPLYPGLSDDDQRRVIDALWESAADKSASLPKAVLGAINMALEPTTLPGQCAPRFVTAAREQP